MSDDFVEEGVTDRMDETARGLLDAFLVKMKERAYPWAWSECHEFRRLRHGPDPLRREAVSLLMPMLSDPARPLPDPLGYVLTSLLQYLLETKPPLDDRELRAAIDLSVTLKLFSRNAICEPAPSLATMAEQLLAAHRPSDKLAQTLRRFRATMNETTPVNIARGVVRRLDALLGESDRVELDLRDTWSARIRDDLGRMAPAAREAWHELFLLGWRHDNEATPSKTFMRAAAPVIDRIGLPELRRHSVDWLTGITLPPRRGGDRKYDAYPDYEPGEDMKDRNALYLRALVWVWSRRPDGDVARAIADLAIVCLTKMPDVGAYSDKLGNACIYTLGVMPSMDAVAQLARLKQKVKYRVALRLIEKAYQRAADREGGTVDDVQEIALPTFGLDREGTKRVAVGEHVAVLRIVDSTKAAVQWLTKDGGALKSVPSAVKAGHADTLKELRTELKYLNAQLAAERARIELQLRADRTLPFAQWRTRYVDHPLLQPTVRALIWEFDTGTGTIAAIPHASGLVDQHDTPIAPADGWAVRLWHPVTAPAPVIVDWRRWMRRHEMTQPFRQAERESYALTAEEASGGLSSIRFGGHLIQEHILHPLCRTRGWRYELQVGNPGNYPTLALPQCRLQAEFLVRAGEHGLFATLYADHVCFTSDGVAVSLTDVPPRVFSEVMRDVELFVSVCSITLDPSWHNREGPEADFWTTAAFGELSAGARQRRRVLEGMLDQLTIARQCHLEDRFLVVSGQLRTYRIHLGSAQVTMEPRDRFLAIALPEEALPPGEPDAVLGLILRKAFLLARDSRIADAELRRLIEEGR